MSKKEDIIHSALTLFAKHGFSETSIDKIARHAKVSKGLTYTHFKNKDDLLKAVIQHSLIRLTAEMIDLNEMTIEALFINYFESLRKNKETIRLCFLLMAHPETPEEVNSMLERQKEELLGILSLLLKEKFKDDSEQEANILLGTLDGLALDFVIDPNTENLKVLESYLINKYV